MGGSHVMFLSEEALQFCDSVVIGEAESVWKEVIADFEAGTLKTRYYGEPLEDWPSEVYEQARADALDGKRTSLEVTRGCKFACDFCSIPGITGRKIRYRDLDSVIELLKVIRQRRKDLVFIDNNIYANPEKSKEFFRKLAPLKLKWVGSCSIDIGQDPEALRLARESGCDVLLIGYEIIPGSEEVNKGGKYSKAQRYRELTRNINKAGIKVKAQFIFGFDDNSFKTLWQLWWFAFRLNPLVSSISFLTPLPGTRLFKQFLEQDRIINLNWRYYACYHFTITHPHVPLWMSNYLYLPVNCLFSFTVCRFGRIAFLTIAILWFLTQLFIKRV